MKTIRFKNLATLFVFLVFFSVSSAFSQHGQMNGSKNGQGYKQNIPDLTEEQQKKIDEFAITHQKKMLQFKNQINEKDAALNTLRTADKADMNAINKTIDEMGAIKIQMMKERENHHQQVRAILTDKQRVIFDSHQGMGKGHGNKGMYKGERGEKGNGPRQNN
jgi:Spy/CpxP family protein refolding chaperone